MKSLQLFCCIAAVFISSNLFAQPLPLSSDYYERANSQAPLVHKVTTDYLYDGDSNLVKSVDYDVLVSTNRPKRQDFFEYNNEQKVNRHFVQQWDIATNSWKNSWQNLAFYNDSIQETVNINQYFYTNQWLNNSRITSRINSEGNQEKITEYWDNSWYIQNMLTDHLDSLGKLIKIEGVNYNSAGVLISQGRTDFLYDSIGRLIEKIENGLQNGEWQIDKKFTYSYIGSSLTDNVMTELSFNPYDSTFIPIEKITFLKPDPDDEIYIYEETEDNGITWNMTVRNIRTKSPIIEQFIIDRWDSSINTWIRSVNIGLEYNTDGSMNRLFAEKRDPINSQIFYLDNEKIYNYTPTSTKPQPLQAKITISPNPTTDHLIVKVDTNTATKPYQITLIDGQGRVLEQQFSILTENRLSLREYPAGYYFLQISQNGATKSVPVIKQ